jgi:predicted DNA-binding protein YlxM (UPF0122 family)
MLQNTFRDQSLQPTYFRNTEYNADLDNSLNNPRSLGHRVITTIAIGTFGLMTPQFLATHVSTSMWGNTFAVQDVKAEGSDNQNNVIDQLEFIRKITKASVTELAKVFGVSRQAVHDWIKGASISEKNIVTIKNFENTIQLFLKADLVPSIQDLRRKVNGNSLLECLRSKADSMQLTNMLISTLQREQAQRIKLAERFKNRPKLQLHNEDFGAPHLTDEA